MKHFYNKSLKNYNTFGLDVIADELILLDKKEDLPALFNSPMVKLKKRMILGGGSNILFQGDFNGTVIKNEIKGIRIVRENKDFFEIEAASGEVWDDFVNQAVQNQWFGIENLSLIPGTVGAAPIQNIGAYGQDVSRVILKVEYFDTETLQFATLNNTECFFGYRQSIFKNELKGKAYITAVTFRLAKTFIPDLSYKDLAARFEKSRESNISPSAVREAVINIRQAKLPDPAKIGNAGSFFKNPVLSNSRFNELRQKFPEVQGYLGVESTKVAAGWLIDSAGWKGKRLGNCGTYEKQALVVVNHGDATPQDILNIKDRIKHDVFEKFGIILEEEVNII